MSDKKKVVVGMSGGVDSSVAALLLKEMGYEVIGVTMQIWQGETLEQMKNLSGCCSATIFEDAGKVAEILGIPYHIIDFRQQFQKEVVSYFSGEYLRGRTPNPCVVCNHKVKWEALLRKADELGAEYIATGHYARIDLLKNGRYTIRNSVTAQKDQTYALYQLSQRQLSRTLMPVGSYEKEQIREMAKQAGLPVAGKPDSQDICFVPDGDYAGFIRKTSDEKLPGPGNYVTKDGTVLGRHKGITNYTIGQRRGLELPMGHRVFVTQIRPDTNEVVVGENEELFTDTVLCNRLNFMAVEDLKGEMRVRAKIRYNHAGEYCIIRKSGEDQVRCLFEKKVRAATPGQSVVFYEEDHVLGGGTIC